MENSIWLLAYLFSRENSYSLVSFYKAVSVLRSGARLFSNDFMEACPDLKFLRQKYSVHQLQEFQRELFRDLSSGILLLYPGHEFYPRHFLLLEEVPFLLRMKGSPIWLGLDGISIVGHREPSKLSLDWMEEHLGEFLCKNSCFVVSGGARGVDQKAHHMALRKSRPTVVLLPSGLQNLYPSSIEAMTSEILAGGGALLSEYESSRKMQKHFFAQRNRLISGLGKATLVIEARRHSGTLLTAREAIEQSRPLWVLPGHPMDPHCQGSLDLLLDGATPIQSASDLSLLFSSEIQNFSEIFQESAKYLVGSSF